MYYLSDGSENRGDKYKLTIPKIDALEFKSIDVLILLGCNAGHYDYKWSNVAYAFNKRITGCVVASEGTVKSGNLNDIGGAASFKSIKDGTFNDICIRATGKKRDNRGWIVIKMEEEMILDI